MRAFAVTMPSGERYWTVIDEAHLMPDSRALGCDVAGADLHVVRRANPNGAWAKSRRQRAVPLDFVTVHAFEFARRAIGEVAVPYGTCSEPSNVQAGGNGCPYRFRCAGCGHFRTDVSYLPDLHAYLDDLPRNRERVLAAAEIDQWARAEAVPPASRSPRSGASSPASRPAWKT
jgi:hypothetical protein